MVALSAPSPKIFTFRSAREFIVCSFGCRSNNPISSFAQRLYGSSGGPRRTPFFVSVVDQHSLTAGIVAGINIPPAVAHHETAMKVDLVLAGRAYQQARKGLP